MIETTEQITYGLMTPVDYSTMNKMLDAVCTMFPSGTINTLELGVHKGYTSIGIHKFFETRDRINFHTGIDNGHDVPMDEPPFPGCHIIVGNTYEVYNRIADNSQHFGLIDANHSFPMTIIDVFCYCTKIKVGGLLALHDTGPHIKAFVDYQGIGDKDDPDMYISCRRAAQALGLFNERSYVNGCQFEKVIEVADNVHHTGGILCLKRVS